MGQTVTGPLGAEGRYWEALAEEYLELPQCVDCGRWQWPAVWRCGKCGSWKHRWRAVSLTGTIFTWTRTWHKFGGTEGIDKPFVTVLVSLAEAPIRLLGLLEGSEEGVKIGAAVTGRIDRTRFGEQSVSAIRWRLNS